MHMGVVAPSVVSIHPINNDIHCYWRRVLMYTTSLAIATAGAVTATCHGCWCNIGKATRGTEGIGTS
jgi:hypothetical protein